ncbi:MAG TPA: SDR family oxidoreductase [Chloroflexota bacterium]|nr:SDR family oxidoreductase [Chloroflexota bacterium]
MESGTPRDGARLAGKVALVAGASSGMGHATALALAREGAEVALVARRAGPLDELAARITLLGGRAVACPADLTDPGAVEAAFARTEAELGPIDVVIHTAGTNIPQRALTVLTQAGWDEVMRASVETAFQVTRAAVPRLRGRGGRIIYVSSLAVQRPDTSGVAYQAAKHAVVGLAHGTMQEERANGIRTTVIFPGLTDTPLILKRPVPTPPEILAKALQPEDIAAACVFIATLPSRANVPELQLAPSEL